MEYHLRKKKAQVLLVTSGVENEGKSTVAANLALAMAEKHRKVLLIDGDLMSLRCIRSLKNKRTAMRPCLKCWPGQCR